MGAQAILSRGPGREGTSYFTWACSQPRGAMKTCTGVWKLVGVQKSNSTKSALEEGTVFGEFIGVVNHISSSGNSLVSCPEARERYGRHVFIHKSVLAKSKLV